MKIGSFLFMVAGIVVNVGYAQIRQPQRPQFPTMQPLEQPSEHPIGVGIVAKARERNLDVLRIENFKALTSKGVAIVCSRCGDIAGGCHIQASG